MSDYKGRGADAAHHAKGQGDPAENGYDAKRSPSAKSPRAFPPNQTGKSRSPMTPYSTSLNNRLESSQQPTNYETLQVRLSGATSLIRSRRIPQMSLTQSR
jgi:hypothetical protein